MTPTTKRNEGELLLVRLIADEPAVRVVGAGVREARRVPAAEGGGGEEGVALGHGVPGNFHIDHQLAHEEDDGRVDAQGLHDAGVQEGHVRQGLVGEVVTVLFHVAPLFLDGAGHVLGELHEEEARPRARDAARVLPGEQHRNHHAGELLHLELAPVLVFLVHKGLQGVVVRDVRVRPALVDDGGEELAHLQAGGVPAAVRGGWGVTPEHGDSGEPLVEALEQLGHLPRQAIPNLIPHERAAGRENNKLRELVPQVHGPALPVLAEEVLGLEYHGRHVRHHLFLAQRDPEKLELLLAHVQRYVVDHPRPEDRHCEVVGLILVELQVRSREEGALRLRPHQEGQPLPQDLQRKHRAQLLVLCLRILQWMLPKPDRVPHVRQALQKRR
mmetsp:Transcript_22439/g.63018  ORF Transcript_22439/g.63018 Transcript_22439/m.63018 type:complete len:386 (+) Transcript_22439:475-1632(+)